MNFKKYIVQDHSDGKRYEVVTDELGYIRDKQPTEEVTSSVKQKPEPKPVSFEQIKRLYNKEFPTPINNGNEVKKLKQLIDNAQR